MANLPDLARVVQLAAQRAERAGMRLAMVELSARDTDILIRGMQDFRLAVGQQPLPTERIGRLHQIVGHPAFSSRTRTRDSVAVLCGKGPWDTLAMLYTRKIIPLWAEEVDV